MLYTREGDSGRSGTKTRRNLGKDSPVFELIGTLEEAISQLQVAALKVPKALVPVLTRLEEELHLLLGEMAGEGRFATPERVAQLERAIDSLYDGSADADAPAGRSEGGAALDVARAVLRRAERKAVAMMSVGGVTRDALAWLNRVSDLIWAVARLADRTGSGNGTAAGEFVPSEGAGEGFCKEAIRLCAKVLRHAREQGLRVVAAVADAGANPVALLRDDDAYIASVDIAMNKAWTSASLKMDTVTVGRLTQPGAELYGLQITNQGKIVTFGGGVPLLRNGKVVGALGVSGGTAEQDTALAEWGGKQF